MSTSRVVASAGGQELKYPLADQRKKQGKNTQLFYILTQNTPYVTNNTSPSEPPLSENSGYAPVYEFSIIFRKYNSIIFFYHRMTKCQYQMINAELKNTIKSLKSNTMRQPTVLGSQQRQVAQCQDAYNVSQVAYSFRQPTSSSSLQWTNIIFIPVYQYYVLFI